jgi:hypothetical protein
MPSSKKESISSHFLIYVEHRISLKIVQIKIEFEISVSQIQ